MSSPIYTPASYTFAEGVDNLLKQNKITGQDAAKRIGIGQSCLSAAKRGSSLPAEHWVTPIATNLGGDVATLKAAYDRDAATRSTKSRKIKTPGVRGGKSTVKRSKHMGGTSHMTTVVAPEPKVLELEKRVANLEATVLGLASRALRSK